MDCERFDQHVIGELYDELDELTHAALERHVAGCSRCAGVLSGLRATRSVAILPLVEPPDDLEARILATALDTGATTAQVAPAAPPNAQRGGVLRVLRWAARPPLAMAAAFLLLIGASLALFQGSAKRAEPAATMAEAAPRGAAAPAATAPATAAPAAEEGAEQAKVAAGEPPPPAAAASAVAEDGGALQQQVVAAARSRAAAAPAKPAAADSSLLAAEADKPAGGAGAPAGAKAAKRPADVMGGVNPRAPAAPAPAPRAAPRTNVGFAP